MLKWKVFLKDELLLTPMRGFLRGVMVKAMVCGIVVIEFVLQSRYYVHFRTNTLGEPPYPPSYIWARGAADRVSTVPGEHCQKIVVSNPTQAGQRFTWSKTWCDRQQLWKAVITGDTVTRLSIPIWGRGKSEVKFGRNVVEEETTQKLPRWGQKVRNK